MANYNKTILIGRLTADPEVRTTPNGNTVAAFRLASSISKRDPQTGAWIDDPNPLYIDCEAWSSQYGTRLVDVVRDHCHQGTQVLVTARLRFEQWDDQTTGQKRSKHKLTLDDIQLLGQPAASNGSHGQSRAQNQGGGNYQSRGNSGQQRAHQDEYRPDDDIPF